MEDLVFGRSVQERRRVAAYGLTTLMVLSAVALSLTLRHGPVAMVLAFGGVLACVVGVWIYNGGSTGVGAEGILVRRFPLPPVRVPWEAVASIDVHASAGTMFGTIRTLRLRDADGRTFRLRPMEDGARRQDPDFDEKCEQIVDLWERYA